MDEEIIVIKDENTSDNKTIKKEEELTPDNKKFVSRF